MRARHVFEQREKTTVDRPRSLAVQKMVTQIGYLDPDGVDLGGLTCEPDVAFAH
jgi:hypothetical protein